MRARQQEQASTQPPSIGPLIRGSRSLSTFCFQRRATSSRAVCNLSCLARTRWRYSCPREDPPRLDLAGAAGGRASGLADGRPRGAERQRGSIASRQVTRRARQAERPLTATMYAARGFNGAPCVMRAPCALGQCAGSQLCETVTAAAALSFFRCTLALWLVRAHLLANGKGKFRLQFKPTSPHSKFGSRSVHIDNFVPAQSAPCLPKLQHSQDWHPKQARQVRSASPRGRPARGRA